jgi:hypothetical protein
MPDPTKYITFFEDFCDKNSYPIAAASLAAASNDTWTVTVTEGGAGDAASAMGGINGGVLSLVTDAGDNDLIFSQRKGASILPTAGKPLFFKTRFLITDANANLASIANTEWYFGLMVTDTDPLSSAAGAGVGDGMFFMSEDGTQDIKFYVQLDASTQLITTLTDTLTVATQTEFAFYFDGARYVEIFVNGYKKQTVDLTTTLATYLPNQPVTISFGIKNGEAVAKTMVLDYIFCAQER